MYSFLSLILVLSSGAQTEVKVLCNMTAFYRVEDIFKHISPKISIVQTKHPQHISYSSEDVNFHSQLDKFCFCLSYSVLPILRYELMEMYTV